MYTCEKQQPKYRGSFHEDTKISNTTIFYLFLQVSSIQMMYLKKNTTKIITKNIYTCTTVKESDSRHV